MLLCTHAKKASEGHDRIGDAPAYLLDHQTLDASDICALRIIDGRTFHPIALDQGPAGHCCRTCLCHGNPPKQSVNPTCKHGQCSSTPTNPGRSSCCGPRCSTP